MSYRYIGNKTVLADTILEIIQSYIPSPAVVADPMCGTAAMSAALRARNYRVVASDIMTFAAQHARVRLLLNKPPAFTKLGLSYSDALLHLNRLEPIKGYCFREYSPLGKPSARCAPRKYLTPDNAAKVDAIREELRGWVPLLTELEHSLLSHDLILAVNKIANIAGTYGHFRSAFSQGSLRPLELQPTHFQPGITQGHKVLQGPVEQLAPRIKADACYLDPPYIKRQYAANYHLLETLARGDEPEAMGVSGLRDWWDQYSDFCSKRRIADAFVEVIGKMKCPLFFISYSEDGLLSAEALLGVLEEFGPVALHQFPHKRFRSNKGGSGGTVNEQLYVVRVRQ